MQVHAGRVHGCASAARGWGDKERRRRRTTQGASSTSITSLAPHPTAPAGAACGIKGDPFDLVTPAGTNDGANFGFVVLGAALTIFLQVGYEQANKRGWLDSVKARINGYAPGAGGGSGVSVGGSSRVSSPMGTPKAGGGGYNAGASSLDAAPATPFSAGGYGSL